MNLLVTDLDGTLLSFSKRHLSSLVRFYIQRWHNQGHIWAIASGRPFPNIMNLLYYTAIYPSYIVAQNQYIYKRTGDKYLPAKKKHVQKSKGHAIKKIASHENMLEDSVITLGNSSNDKTMLNDRFNFKSYTHRNATPQAKDWSDFVVGQNGIEALQNIVDVSLPIVQSVNDVIQLDEDPLFVRYSCNYQADIESGYSYHQEEDVKEPGLSVRRINLMNPSPAIKNFEFLRLWYSDVYGWICGGKKTGIDTTGSPTIRVEKILGSVGNRWKNKRRRQESIEKYGLDELFYPTPEKYKKQ